MKAFRGLLTHYTTVKTTWAHNVGFGSSYLKSNIDMSLSEDMWCWMYDVLKKSMTIYLKKIKNAWTLK